MQTAVSPPTATPIPISIAESAAPVNAASTGCENPIPANPLFGLSAWPQTNFCLHSVSYDEIRSGGVRKDRIAAINEPKFETVAEVNVWLADVEPVLVYRDGNDARAYPLQVLVWHEIVNDVVNGRPVVITYCPLCSAGLVFERVVAGDVLDFGTTGNLHHSDLIMYDRQTESWWQQFTGESIVGTMTGTQLTMLPSQIVSWGDFKTQFANGRILSPDTGYELYYGETPYINFESLTYDRVKFFDSELDDRLHPKRRVRGVRIGDTAIAYPYDLLAEVGVINDTVDGKPIVVFWQSGTTSALYSKVIAESRDVGASAIFDRQLNGQLLTFAAAPDGFQDNETGSVWNLFGTAVSGPLVGEQLTAVPSHEFFWFAWAAFQPETQIYGQP